MRECLTAFTHFVAATVGTSIAPLNGWEALLVIGMKTFATIDQLKILVESVSQASQLRTLSKASPSLRGRSQIAIRITDRIATDDLLNSACSFSILGI